MRGTVRGISIDESTRVNFRNRKAAEEIKTKRQNELLEESIYGKRVTVTFSQAALSYRESGGKQGGAYRLDDVIKHFGTTKLAKIGAPEIHAGAVAVFPTMQPASRRTHFYIPVSAILSHAHKMGWCDEIKFEWPSPSEGVVRWLTKEEAHSLIDEGKHIKPLMTFLFYTGARISEAMDLQMQDLDLDRAHVQFIDTKNGTSRGVPLHTRVVEAMRKYLAVYRHNGGDVFRREDGLEYKHEAKASDRIKTVFKRACKRAGITNFRIHDTRHTWATWHYQKNRDLGALQKLGGWKTLEMVMRYAHTNVEELGDTIARL
ncbi:MULTISPECIES: site-specific integrase [unclassified Bradyrhizobium]|uniref:tyrosine-type recombinase/integrase n=1 Tax=unclassified Bradyrhizobium TaxID=2631580 RepID=UPI001FF93B29|nr:MULTISPECIES: site-specific integrase [unclassified Bradyrhizobium]